MTCRCQALDRMILELREATAGLPGEQLVRPAPEGAKVVRLLTAAGVVERILVREEGEHVRVCTLAEYEEALAENRPPPDWRRFYACQVVA